MEPRDPVGLARPKEAELQGGRLGPNENNQEGAVGLLRRDDAINGAISEGEGLEEQGEGLEEQEFSIKEASFQEGSLKLKIQTTKRTKKPPKNLENYICPPEIRMTIRPPVGEGRSGRQGRTSGAGARASKDEEKGPPRKRVHCHMAHFCFMCVFQCLIYLRWQSPIWLVLLLLLFPCLVHVFSTLFHCKLHKSFLFLISRGRGLQEVSEQLFGNIKKKYGRKESQKVLANPQSGEVSWEKQPEKDSPAHSEERSKYRHEETSEQYPEEREEGNRMTEESKGRKRRWKPSFDESFPTESSHQLHDSDSTEKHQNGPPEPKVAHKHDPQKNDIPKPRSNSSPSPSHSISSTGSSKLTKGKDRWSYLKAMKHTSLLSPQRDNKSSPSPFVDPPSPFPITPSSPLYTNTDSLTVHTPIKRKRGRPKKQPLLTVETIHEGTSTSPPSPLSQASSAALNRKRKTHTLNSLVHVASSKRGRGHRPVSRVKLGKMQSILNEILTGSSQGGPLSLKSASAPVTTAMTAVASTIEARLGKQINVSKRGTIYIGKKRGRKPRAETQDSKSSTKERSLFSGLHESAVPSTTSSPSLRADASMPSLQPISALPSKPLGRGFLSAGWKLSPPRLLANSPSHLSEGASVKEATLSPISESHSEETIPSDSGIGTDNNTGALKFDNTALDASSRGRRTHCERQVTSVDNFLSQQEKKQKHHRRKRKCLQTRDHLHFLAELEEVVLKLQQLRVSHRRYTCYPQHPYPSIFRLNFHHFYPMTYDSYPCEPSPYMRRSVDLKAKRRRGRPAKASEPITSKLPFVQGYGYPLAGGNYYAAPYAMPYAPPLGLGYFPPAPPFYLPHPSLGPAPSSPFMRPAVPPPKAYHSAAHSNLQPGTKLHGASGSMQGASVRAESLANSSAGGLRLHKRKHKHKHKHKDEPLLSPRDHQDLGGLFSGAKANARLSMMTDRRDFSQASSNPLEKQKNSGRAPSLGMFGEDPNQQPSHSLSDNQLTLRQTGQPIKSFLNSYSSEDDYNSPISPSSPSLRHCQCLCAAGKRRYKRREVEQIQNNVRRMHSLNFEHVQKILRAKRLQRQAKTGNNVIKRRPGRPRKQPVEADGRTLGMPVLERCDDLPGRQSVRSSLTPEALEFSNHDSIAATIETVVHQATSVPPHVHPTPLPSVLCHGSAGKTPSGGGTHQSVSEPFKSPGLLSHPLQTEHHFTCLVQVAP
uniref:Uncharacterized protein n=1 Tax=Periophthalmus magnuspinnatus TaxID=409849 RepID=A0A3B4BE49_9GOBI